ncbi:MAG TPA: prepilin-type N-terminal cleavage/methylation domain-containing protein [Polyangia bacterium]|jgi:prepilin-type N-terminal cleavage/methylation domain-containing protein
MEATNTTGRRGRRARAAGGGFTLVEVMVAMVVGSIGLLGTVAVQQTMFNATANASDAAIATRLAMRAMEEYDAKIVTAGPPIVDQLAAAVTTGWSTPAYVSPLGAASASATPDFRFKREAQVINLGPAQPYNISVQITFALDTGVPKIVRLDGQRYKTW